MSIILFIIRDNIDLHYCQRQKTVCFNINRYNRFDNLLFCSTELFLLAEGFTSSLC